MQHPSLILLLDSHRGADKMIRTPYRSPFFNNPGVATKKYYADNDQQSNSCIHEQNPEAQNPTYVSLLSRLLEQIQLPVNSQVKITR